MAIAFDPTVFRARFKEFSDDTVYTDDLLNAIYTDALCYISDTDRCGVIAENCRARALNLMVAHIAKTESIANDGGSTGFVTSSSIGDVSVTVQAPKEKNDFGYWLDQTPYGQQILALFKVSSIGGFYIGGSRERQSFRKSDGRF